MPKLFGALNSYERPTAKTAYFKQFAKVRRQAMRLVPNQSFRLLLPAEKPDFTAADQGWIAQMGTEQLTWEDW